MPKSESAAVRAVKREAKLLARTGELTYCQILDQRARSSGYSNWKALHHANPAEFVMEHDRYAAWKSVPDVGLRYDGSYVKSDDLELLDLHRKEDVDRAEEVLNGNEFDAYKTCCVYMRDIERIELHIVYPDTGPEFFIGEPVPFDPLPLTHLAGMINSEDNYPKMADVKDYYPEARLKLQGTTLSAYLYPFMSPPD